MSETLLLDCPEHDRVPADGLDVLLDGETYTFTCVGTEGEGVPHRVTRKTNAAGIVLLRRLGASTIDEAVAEILPDPDLLDDRVIWRGVLA